mgnify:CR=1 FL=1
MCFSATHSQAQLLTYAHTHNLGQSDGCQEQLGLCVCQGCAHALKKGRGIVDDGCKQDEEQDVSLRNEKKIFFHINEGIELRSQRHWQ